ncbi:MAG TPA: DNA polymerase III subunit beta [Terriglobales bacterium]|nr:DNA polymerase III subunit beta [Terriglobales bacterium]
MEFTITRDEMLQGLYLTQGVVERRTTIPILANVLFESDGDGVVISATDQEIGVRRRCEAKVKKKGALTTGARKLYEIVRECPEGPITIKLLDNSWISLAAERSRFKMVGLDPKEFPAMPAAPATGAGSVSLPTGLLREMIERTIFAVSLDETRMNLSGVFFERPEKDKVRIVATDGHRLSMITRKVEGASQAEGVIIPRKGVAEIAKIIESGEDTITLTMQEGVAHAARGGVELSMRLVEGEFPDYRQVVPQKSELKFSVGGAELLAALRRVSVVSSERTKGVKISLEPGKLEVSSINPDLGEAMEELTVDYAGSPFAIGFNAKYVMDALAVLPLETPVQLSFNDEVSPGILRSDSDADYLYVVMPMRL